MEPVLYLLDVAGIAVFAVTGSLAAGRRGLDIFGALFIAVVTALGGGTVRDVVLGLYPVFWTQDPKYLLVALLAGGAVVLPRHVRSAGPVLLWADAVGLAVFSALGTRVALEADYGASIAIVMGMVTGVVGGMLRDLLTGRVPLVLRRDLYATASLCGATVLVLLWAAWPGSGMPLIVGMLVTLAIRSAAIRWRLRLPASATR